MFPVPYLAAVSPDATSGSVVYRLSARQPEGTLGAAQFFLLDGKVNYLAAALILQTEAVLEDADSTGGPLSSFDFHASFWW